MIDKSSVMKRKLMLALVKDEKIRDLLNNANAEYPTDLIGKNVFPYLKVDSVVEEAKICIGISVDFPSIVQTNEAFKNAQITILTICDNEILNMSNGYCRTDLVVERISELINWNDLFGFKMKLISNNEAPLDNKFYTREIIFETVTSNDMVNGNRINK